MKQQWNRSDSQSYLGVAASLECQRTVEMTMDHFNVRELEMVLDVRDFQRAAAASWSRVAAI